MMIDFRQFFFFNKYFSLAIEISICFKDITITPFIRITETNIRDSTFENCLASLSKPINNWAGCAKSENHFVA